MRRSALRWMLAAALAAGALPGRAETVGRVLLAAGDAFAVRSGQQVRLALNSPVESADVLRTGPASSLQVRFSDEGMIELRENSEFAIEQYHFSGKADGSERGFFHLLKGGFRAVSGLIGRVEHDNYKVRTETSTIGIRGTDYAVRDCRGDCGQGVRNGLYGRVLGLSSGTNQVTLTNNTGVTVFGINQNFYVAGPNSRPQPLLQPPTFVSLRPQGRGHAAEQGGSGTGGEQAGGSSGITGESRPASTTDVAVTSPLITQPFQATETLGSGGTPAALPSPNGFVVAYALGPGAPGGFGFDDGTIAGTVNGQNQLLSYGTLGTFPAGTLGAGSITDAGSVVLPNGQTFVWGRWTGNTQVTASDSLTYSNVPLLFGTASGIQQVNNFVGTVGGSATYSFAGGPKPVDAAGNVGSLTGSSLLIDFTNLLASYSLSINFPSVTVASTNYGSAAFSLSGSGTHSGSQGGEFEGGLTGSCVGSGCLTSTPYGYFGVGLTGTQGYEFAVVPGVINGTQAGDVAFLNTYNASGFTPGAAPANPSGTTGSVAFASASPSVANVATLNSSQVSLSGSNLTAFGDGVNFPSGMLNSGSVVETGSTSLVDGSSMSWGRWTGAGIALIGANPGNVSLNGSQVQGGMPYVLGANNAIVPGSGSFLYTFAGGPNPTDTNGAVGSWGSPGSFIVTFGTTQVIAIVSPLVFSVAGNTYSLSGGQSVAGPAQVMGNITLGGTCSPSCSVATGSAAAVLVGPSVGGLAVAGTVSGGPATVSFAGAFKR